MRCKNCGHPTDDHRLDGFVNRACEIAGCKCSKYEPMKKVEVEDGAGGVGE